MADRSDEYMEIDVTIKTVLDRSVWVKHEGEEGNIARSLIHAGDDARLDDADRGDEMRLRVRAWKLANLGWQ